MITVEEIKQNLVQLNFSSIEAIYAEMDFYIWDLIEMDFLNESYNLANTRVRD